MADTTDSHGQRPCKPPHLQLHFLASFSRRRRSAPPPGRPDAGPLAQAAARRCPATIRLTGGASRQRVGWCSDPQLCDHEFLGVLFFLTGPPIDRGSLPCGRIVTHPCQDKGPGGNVPSLRRAVSPGAPQIRLSAVRLLLADGPDGQPGATGYAGRLVDAAQADSAWARDGP